MFENNNNNGMGYNNMNGMNQNTPNNMNPNMAGNMNQAANMNYGQNNMGMQNTPNMNGMNSFSQPVNQNTNNYQTNPSVVNQTQNVGTPQANVFGASMPEEAKVNTESTPSFQFKTEEVEAPKYGNASNDKANLNDDANSGLKFIIILAIIMLLFIIFLPQLSSLI